MSHLLRFACRVALSTGAAAVLLAASFATAEDKSLPLKRVVMFNSGVGFFEHSGNVEGNRQVEFPVNVSDINDLLKSLVVQDRGGGKVAVVSYSSPEPITRTLRSLAIDVSNNPSLAQMLQQLRGQKVEVSVVGGANPLVGTVVGTEKRRSVVGPNRDQIVETELLNLRTAEGLRSVPLDTVMLTRFLDENTDRDFQRALTLLATAHQRDQKGIKFDLRGNGQRPVSIGYVQESPVWKTSYRLVIDGDKPPHLQGWAIVENTTAQDWSDVNLTLVSGRPVSFQMDLYQPLFATRPVVAPDLPVAVSPRIHEQDLASRDDEFRAAGQPAVKTARRSVGAFGGGLGGGGLGGGAARGSGGGAMNDSPVSGSDAMMMGASGGNAMRMGRVAQSVESAVQGQDIGESFRYAIKTPVTLRRNESAMLPIVNDPIKGTKVFVFNSATHAKHPMVALRLTNSTDLHWQQGPVTVFDSNEYAGDARISDIPPGSTRLVTYAMDLDTEVVSHSTPAEKILVKLSLQKGGLHVRHKESRRHEYVIKNSGDRVKRLLLERPIDTGWPTITPKPEETTRDQHRFAANAEPGQPTTVTITEERLADEQFNLASVDVAQVELFINAKAATPALRAALENLLTSRTAHREASDARAAVERELQEAATEEQRLRENLVAVRNADAAYQQFLKKLTAEEDRIEKLRTRLAQARADEASKLKAWEKLAATLVVE